MKTSNGIDILNVLQRFQFPHVKITKNIRSIWEHFQKQFSKNSVCLGTFFQNIFLFFKIENSFSDSKTRLVNFLIEKSFLKKNFANRIFSDNIF